MLKEIKSFWEPKKAKSSKVKQSYWNSKSKVPVWKQQNDDKKLGARLHREAQEEFNKGNYEEASFKKHRSNWVLGHHKDEEAVEAIKKERDDHHPNWESERAHERGMGHRLAGD